MFFLVGVDDPKVAAAAMQPGAKPLPINRSPFFAPKSEPSIWTGVEAVTLALLSVLSD